MAVGRWFPGARPRHTWRSAAPRGALISRARGASLGAVEADVLTWLLAQWVQAGCSPDGVIHTTLYQLTAALYGSRAKGTEDRRAVAGALLNLHMASITVSDYDSATDDELAGRWVDVHLVKRIHYGEQLQALQDRQHVSAAELGALRGETLSIYIDDWLIGRSAAGQAAGVAGLAGAAPARRRDREAPVAVPRASSWIPGPS